MTLQDWERLAVNVGSILLLDLAIAAIAIEARNNWPLIRAALSGRHGRSD